MTPHQSLPQAPFPLEPAPMLATLGAASQVSGDGSWHFEVKWDGYRAVVLHRRGTPTEPTRTVLRSRGGLDLAPTYPELGELDALLTDHDAVLDGEVVALTDDGRSDFEALQGHGQPGARDAHLMLFDVLHLDGVDLTGAAYLQRRELLESLVGPGTAHVHVPTTFGEDAELALGASTELRLEGLIAKRAGSTYQCGRRSESWLKLKNFYTQDVVVVGWKAGTGARGSLGSLLLAVNDEHGLVCCGSAGSGFTQDMLAITAARLQPLARSTNPGVRGVTPSETRQTHWVEPVLVGEVSYGMWTQSGRLRHPVWRGLRPDVDASAVIRGDG